MSTEPVRYPDPAVQILDESFAKYRIFNAAVERLATGFRWAEGPVWFGDGRYVLWSDIPNDRIMRWDEETGAVSVFRKPSNFSNGNTRDRQGRLVTCEHDSRRVTRTEYDGADHGADGPFDGKRLNSPNDVVVKSDGRVWFTDPPFGMLGELRGPHGGARAAHQRLPPRSLAAARPRWSTEDIPRPNGLCFSPDESRLYVVSLGLDAAARSGCSTWSRAAPRSPTAASSSTAGAGIPDGIRCDTDGNLWCGWGGGEGLDGVAVFNPDAKLIGRILLPERCANLCFGGTKRNRLFLAASQSLYSIFVNTQGVAGG